MKIAIIGYSGSGKSTLATNLGKIYNIPVLHLDKVHFLENWIEQDDEKAKAMVREFIDKNDSWIIDGNYTNLLREERMEKADRIIFMCYSRLICIYQAYNRYKEYKGKTRESMAAGCHEKFDFEFIKWILLDGRSKEKKRQYLETIQKYKNKTVVLKDKKDTLLFLQNLEIK